MTQGDLDIWLTDPEEVQDPDLLAEYHALMNAEERERHDRYRFPKRRHQFLVTRALVRTTLSRYCPDILPGSWQFIEVSNGRPEISPGQAPLPLRFNISRTDRLIACAVTIDRAIGIDVEAVEASRNTSAIAERCFTPSERVGLDANPEWFYRYWTLKEAYTKARGLGLAIPLNQLSFDLDASRPIRITFDPRIEDDPSRWQFALQEPSAQHVLAVAVDRAGGPDVAVHLRPVVPLRP